MFLKRIDKAAKKRILINVALLMAGTLILVAFLFIMQTQTARDKQNANADSVLEGIDAALSQNESEIETLTYVVTTKTIVDNTATTYIIKSFD